jgi:hypothetical protein
LGSGLRGFKKGEESEGFQLRLPAFPTYVVSERKYSVLSIIRGNGGEGRTDNSETRMIRNIYFIEPGTENKTVIYLLLHNTQLTII